MILKTIFSFISLLNGTGSPRQIAFGMALGAIAGITPLMSLHNVLIFIAILMFQVHFSAAIFSLGVFKILSPLADPLFNKIGYALLVNTPALEPLWVKIYNTPVLPWFGLNNTLTLGSLTAALALFLPLFFIFTRLIISYRERIMARLNQMKIMRVIQASKIWNLYKTYKSYTF